MSVNVVSSRHQGPNRRLGYLRSHFSPRASAQEMTSKNIPCLTRLQGCMATPVVRYNNDGPLRLKCKKCIFRTHDNKNSRKTAFRNIEHGFNTLRRLGLSD